MKSFLEIHTETTTVQNEPRLNVGKNEDKPEKKNKKRMQTTESKIIAKLIIESPQSERVKRTDRTLQYVAKLSFKLWEGIYQLRRLLKKREGFGVFKKK